MLKALANRHRLMILCQLIDGERSVGDLAAVPGLRDSTVSQHLALLRKDGLVSTRREGQTIWYALASEPVPQAGRDPLRHLLRPAAHLCGTARETQRNKT